VTFHGRFGENLLVVAGSAAVETIRSLVEPMYVRVLPTVDEWDQPIMLWSDGQSYRIVSVGRDGHVDRDWKVPDAAGGPTTRPEADIVFSDGQFVAWPEGSQD
jgi:hypothetical protein